MMSVGGLKQTISFRGRTELRPSIRFKKKYCFKPLNTTGGSSRVQWQKYGSENVHNP